MAQSYLGDVTTRVTGTVDVAAQMRRQFTAELLAAVAVHHHAGVAQIGLRRLKHQVAGIAVEIRRLGVAALRQPLLVEHDREVGEFKEGSDAQKLLAPLLLELAEMEFKTRMQTEFMPQRGDAFVRPPGLVAVLKQHQRDEQVFGGAAAGIDTAVAGFIDEHKHDATHGTMSRSKRPNAARDPVFAACKATGMVDLSELLHDRWHVFDNPRWKRKTQSCSMPHSFTPILLRLIALAIVALCHALAAEVSGKVVGVHDGDTLTLLLPEKTTLKVRLQGIDAPELKQPFGSAAKKTLSDLVFGKTVRLLATGKDRYGRTLGDVHVGKTWVNLAMVEKGMAWFYVKYSQDARLKEAEAMARARRLGLWSEAQAAPPWDWRGKKK